jgi:catechol 2,3-dioxygenase-like lactoylglutathione lyase family enzyme
MAVRPPYFFALSVADLESAIAWYSRAFELKLERRLPLPDSVGTGAILTSPDLVLEILSLRGAAPASSGGHDDPPAHGIFKVGFSVPRLGPYLERFQRLGIAIAYGPFDDSTLASRTVIIRDDAGNLLQLFERFGGP